MAEQEVIGLVGLGYVGMPLAMAFAEQYRVIGFDASERRIAELRAGKDSTGEFSAAELAAARRLELTGSAEALAECTFIIVAVPTPLGDFKEPDLAALRGASETVGRVLKPGMLLPLKRRPSGRAITRERKRGGQCMPRNARSGRTPAMHPSTGTQGRSRVPCGLQLTCGYPAARLRTPATPPAG